jgi:membrane protease subunit HflK
VEIMFLGLQGIHPPPQVAPAYQEVVGAVQKKQAFILNAQAQRNTTLTTLAGSVQDANELYILASQYQQAKRQNQLERVEELAPELDRAFTRARGEIYQTLRESQSYAFETATLAEASGLRFASQLKAYRAAEKIYKHRLKLGVLEDALGDIRKYVVVADPNDTQIFIVDVTEKEITSLYKLGGFKESGR